MPAQIIDGKKIAKEITKNVRKEIVELGLTPGLAVILVGDDKPSHLYVSLKEKSAKKVGINFHKYAMESGVEQQEVIDAINFLNNDPEVDAILVQLPLPKDIDENKIIEAINSKKDVDGFHPQIIAAFLKGETDFVPGLSQGIIRLIESTKKEIAGLNTLIIRNNKIFSHPLEKLLQNKEVTVESISPDAADLTEKTLQADIIIIAVGRPEMLKAEMVKEGAILIDVGTTKVKGTLKGDVDFASCAEKAGYITPVPGGVGPITVAMLLENTLRLAKKNRG